PASRSTRLGIVSRVWEEASWRSSGAAVWLTYGVASPTRAPSRGLAFPWAHPLGRLQPAPCGSGDSVPRRAQSFTMSDQRSSRRRRWVPWGAGVSPQAQRDPGDPTLGSPPSLGNKFDSSFQPPPPDYPDHRENARRDRLGESRPDLEPMTHV